MKDTTQTLTKFLVILVDTAGDILSQEVLWHKAEDVTDGELIDDARPVVYRLWSDLIKKEHGEPAGWMLEYSENRKLCIMCRTTFILGYNGVSIPVNGDEDVEVDVCDKCTGIKRDEDDKILEGELDDMYYDPSDGSLIFPLPRKIGSL